MNVAKSLWASVQAWQAARVEVRQEEIREEELS